MIYQIESIIQPLIDMNFNVDQHKMPTDLEIAQYNITLTKTKLIGSGIFALGCGLLIANLILHAQGVPYSFTNDLFSATFDGIAIMSGCDLITMSNNCRKLARKIYQLKSQPTQVAESTSRELLHATQTAFKKNIEKEALKDTILFLPLYKSLSLN